MLLVFDIGNTNITIGVFEEDSLMKTFRIDSDKNLSLTGYEVLLKNCCADLCVKECVIGSVVQELTPIINTACKNIFGCVPFVFKPHTDCGIKIVVQNPDKVGVDRIANSFVAKIKYQLPAIVVDIGTAITFDIVSKKGDFIGGVIMPGIDLQLKSLSVNTSKLPKIEVATSEKTIGDSTSGAILSGVIRGTASAIEGLISRCEDELGEKATIIATGGQSRVISQYMTRKFDYLDHSLTLEGLRFLYEYDRRLLISD